MNKWLVFTIFMVILLGITGWAARNSGWDDEEKKKGNDSKRDA